MQQELAHLIGLRSLAWLAAEDSLFETFLAASGGDAAQIRARANDPALLASVLDFVLGSDDWVIACAAAQNIRPEQVMMARAVLGGGDTQHWT